MAETKLEIIRGDSQEITVTFEDVDSLPLDLTDKTVFFTVKNINGIDSDDDTDAKITKEITVHSDPTAGITIISLTPAETDIEPGEYFYDLQIVYNGSVISTIKDIVTIIQDVTKRIT